MEDRIKLSILLDYYKELLTQKQRDIMELYFNEDLSLAEISELTKTSRQAIYDIIKRCTKTLFDYENKLKLMERINNVIKAKKHVMSEIDRIKDKVEDKDIEVALENLSNYISDSI
ncbi:putative DNA-binding protein [Clostridium sp. MB40-C1]|uniref:putative DNA-binding protein n=1 Tax=Clostridium sp. MB40-C1 TaxID=3070996 RepID=UPI0027E132AA|nr:putative DNA-binding protein [Clostridium sp. MB40-C1]WMJ82069.1 putative DNA-binding protein [Clostridium sp. MB40-C1]